MPAVLLTGGPCDGRTVQVTTAQIFQGFVTCSGSRYIIQNSTSNPVQAFAESSVVPPVTQTTPRSLAAWSDLSNALGVTLNLSLRRSQAARNAALRKLH